MFRAIWKSLTVVPVALLLGVTLTAPPVAAGDVPGGQAAFVAQKCDMCHSVAQAEIVAKVKSEKMKGPDLPAVARDTEWISQFLKREIQLDGQNHKKEYKGTEEELQAISAWLAQLEVPAE